MLAGFVDGRGRAYDIGFRTLRSSLVDADGLLVLGADEGVRAQAAATASMEILDPKPLRLLLPVTGEITATGMRVVFLAAAGLPRKEPFTFYNVALGLHPSAVEHFFTVQGGREFVQFGKADVESSGASGRALEVLVRGPRAGRPTETARYSLRVEPRAAAEEALTALE
ncbi:MAG TPA: hypothetical protein VII27_01240 [Thermoplasmata archaeon]